MTRQPLASALDARLTASLSDPGCGLVAGMIFVVATMWFVTSIDMSAQAALRGAAGQRPFLVADAGQPDHSRVFRSFGVHAGIDRCPRP
jgi:hypothetical protein